ncbi:MAG TPA: zinc-ribbon domain-containing protein [Ktedonobacterales bacterium]
MQCSQCGASVRPGMTECPACGAPLAQVTGGGSTNRGANRYIPGGGSGDPQQSKGSQQLDPGPQQQRPIGSLQRRLQRSQASLPGDDGLDDDGWDDPSPGRSGAGRARGSDGQGYGSVGGRRGASGDDYGERSHRSQPMNGPSSRRPSQGGSGARRGGPESRRDAYDESREEEAYSPYPPYRPEFDVSREAPAPRRTSGPNHRRPMDESAEMSAEGPAYGPPSRSAPRRRARPVDGSRGDPNDFTNPLDDPRSPLRGSQGRRPSQGSGGRAGRASGAGGYGQGIGSYTEAEMRAQSNHNNDDRYGDSRAYPGYRDGYSEVAPAARGGSRGRGYSEPYGRDDDYASREQWAAPGRDEGDSYYREAYGHGQGGRGYDESEEVWQPMAAPGRGGASGAQGRSRSGGGARVATKTRRRRGGALRLVFGLLVALLLVAALGVKFGPKVYDKFIAHTGSGGNGPTTSGITCASQATPPAAIKPASGYSAYGATAFALTYPTGWQTKTQSSVAQNQCDVDFLFAQPNGGAASFNVEEAGAFTSLSDQQVIQAEAQAAQQQGSTLVEITSAATTQSIGGEVWQRREYQVTPKSGVKLHLALLATHHKGAGFAIIMVSSDTGFASDDTTTFEKMLTSFQFI